VLKVLVAPGSQVKKGDTVIILEAMKMELPIRTSREGIVTAVLCREGELVQPERVLVEIADARG
jgi:biotin carboxyl carrier protein